MNEEEITYMIKQLEMNISSTIEWIKFNYSDYKPQPTSAVDHQSCNLNRALERYYHSRKQKDELINLLESFREKAQK